MCIKINIIIASTPNFAFGLTGPQPTFSFKTTTPPNVIIQASVTGGSANVAIQASTDQTHWVNIATLALNSANANTAYTTMTSPWPYGRLNIYTKGLRSILIIGMKMTLPR